MAMTIIVREAPYACCRGCAAEGACTHPLTVQHADTTRVFVVAPTASRCRCRSFESPETRDETRRRQAAGGMRRYTAHAAFDLTTADSSAQLFILVRRTLL